MFFIVLDIFAKNKKYCVLIQSFDLFHKVYVLCIFTCLNVLDICLNGVRDIGGCVRINFLSHTPLAPLDCFMSKLTNQHTHHSISSSKTGHPLVGVLLGSFMQLHKVLILLCICTLAQKFTFLR